MNSIVISNVTVVKSKRKILDSLNLELPKGRAIGLLGPSGSGKTTLMRAIAGLQQIQSGNIEVLGQPAGSAKLREKISYSTQSASVYNDLTCEENLRFYASLYPTNERTIADLIEMVKLDKVRNQLAKSLSGGERTRLALATALVGAPDLMILDEPTVGLDPLLRKDLWQIFKELTNQGKTLLISSHVMDEAVNCDYILLLRDGQVIAQGSSVELFKSTGKSDMEEVFISLVKS